MKNVFQYTLIALTFVVWVTTQGWISTLIVFGGLQLAGFLVGKAKEGSLIWLVLAIVGLVLTLIFFLGAPVAMWSTWGHAQAVIYGFITIVGLIMLVADARTQHSLSQV